MNRKSIDFGSFSQWRSGHREIRSKEVETESGKLEGAPRVDASRPGQELETRPIQRIKRPKNSEKRYPRHPHRDIDVNLPEELRAKLLVERILNTERERLVAEGLEEKLNDYDRASASITGFMQKFADGTAEIEHTPESTPQPHPNDIKLEKCEKGLTKLIEGYEQELAEWENVLSGIPSYLNSRVEEIESISEDHVETDADNEGMLSEVGIALDTYALYAAVLLKELKRLEKANNSTQTQVQSIATNIISRYNYAESSTEDFIPPPHITET